MPTPALVRNALLELGMTALLLFVIVSTVRWVIGDAALAQKIGSVHAQVAVIAAVAALTVLAIILSPGGRRSGAHVNPAVTLALWRMRAFPARAVVPYVSAQLAGSVVGVALARLAWGQAAGRAPVRYAAIAPGPGWQDWQVGLAEAGCLVFVTLIVGFFLAHPTDRIRRALPYALATTTFAIAAGLGTLSGAAVNPARQLIWPSVCQVGV
jgi:glycerol uptake facilitator-like aquaporin